jgi:uncharacterized repeat protein (TIGR03803 family)
MRRLYLLRLCTFSLSIALVAAGLGWSAVSGEAHIVPPPHSLLPTIGQVRAANQIATGVRNFAGPERVLYNFQGSPDGAGPRGTLIADTSGSLYGTTFDGGVGYGTVFKLSRSGPGYIESVLYTFEGGSDGQTPWAGLIADSTGALYGTTTYGGNLGCDPSRGCGTVYKLTPAGSGYTETVLYSFGSYSGDGTNPGFGALVADKTGALYGTTRSGGSANFGTVFKLTPSGSGYTESLLHSFQFGSDSGYPAAGLMRKDGNLYGTTEGFCCPSGAVVFRLTPSRNEYRFKTLYTFLGVPDGDQPVGGVIADSTGALYGTTYVGGNGPPLCGTTLGCGTVFKLTPSGSNYTESILYRFQYNPTGPGIWDGAFPYAGVVTDASGALYGTTYGGGSNENHCATFSCGTIFKLTPMGLSYTETSFAFNGVDGLFPYASLIRVKRVLYGTTQQSTFGSGTVFKMTF